MGSRNCRSSGFAARPEVLPVAVAALPAQTVRPRHAELDDSRRVSWQVVKELNLLTLLGTIPSNAAGIAIDLSHPVLIVQNSLDHYT